jgi:hypothetical protein
MYQLRRHYVDQRLLSELFGLELVPNLMRLLAAISHSSLRFYGLLRRDEEVAANGVSRALLPAVRYAVLAQVGNYLGVKSESIARLSPRVFGKLNRFLSKGF